MISQEDIENLPSDPMLALVVLADMLDERISDFDGTEEGIGYTRANRCVEDIYALIDAHDLDADFPRLAKRQPRDTAAFWLWWNDFIASVRYYRTRILLARRSNPLLVTLSNDHRQRIHTLLTQICAIVPKLGLDTDKQDAIYARLNALATEVDKQRTSAEKATAVFLYICSTLGKGAEKLKPVAELFEKIMKTLGDAKSEEPPPALPSPKSQQIDFPPKQLPGVRSKAELDDDIPF